MNKYKLVEKFTNAVDDMKRNKFNGTYHWYLNSDDNGNDWAIVLGWLDGFEEDENDTCSNGTYRLCTKLAYQPSNSIMQCDYDIDWYMPYDEDTGEVDDTEVCIYSNTNLEKVIDWLLECYVNYNI